ncbi:class II fructose-bisphosphate aldolase [Parafilimonas terrae]|uniref:Fructose-bisphosphate aldolase, class II/tagatose 1,6-diphosphate aldolase GatY/KbaY n=1 Tax=Parafilimonas terrae TaxID=1465490 RepID=A0A1I5Y8B7_9BACT|nr:class II fructose-bisphosphate aldolase [Parafilimonas terrae]SFQ40482.1 fructose-bisphosphate aldolase, class II/tagatose 1,6-diphosphate aldolase GatY/KbaY [Parafilimonas terrae]
MTMKEKLAACTKEGKALLAVNFYNFETLKGLLLAAKQTNSCLILQLSESSLQYLGIQPAVAMARVMLKEFGVEGWVHLDHGSSIKIVTKCLDAGFDSVMIDASEKPFDENVRITKEAVKIAEHYNANVEAELGYIAKLNQSHTFEPTGADDAKRFVEATGINALAVAIGNAHGFYKEIPKLRIDRLKEIRAAVNCALVLHGSSGIPGEQLQEAIRNGISKINLATETKNTFMKKLQSLLAESDEIDLRKVFPKAIDAVKDLIVRKLDVVNV